MNRFKFRIWSKKYRRWEENSSSLHCSSNWQIDAFTGKACDFIIAISGGGCEVFAKQDVSDDYIIQQSTGLKDSKRREIFEGDILEYEVSGRKYTDQVFWEEDSFMVGPTKNRAVYYLGTVNKTAKIIGNIMETPKILKSRLTS